MGADAPHRHRLEGLLLPLDDHDRPQSSSASRVTAGALGFLSLHPVTRAARLIPRGLALRHDALQTDSTRMLEDEWPHLVEPLVPRGGARCSGGQTGKRGRYIEPEGLRGLQVVDHPLRSIILSPDRAAGMALNRRGDVAGRMKLLVIMRFHLL
jgi:hypothetical protein